MVKYETKNEEGSRRCGVKKYTNETQQIIKREKITTTTTTAVAVVVAAAASTDPPGPNRAQSSLSAPGSNSRGPRRCTGLTLRLVSLSWGKHSPSLSIAGGLCGNANFCCT